MEGGQGVGIKPLDASERRGREETKSKVCEISLVAPRWEEQCQLGVEV